jgi:hypothetical protein
MYSHGRVLSVVTSAGTAAAVTTMPDTGMESTVQIAVAAAAGLLVWAGIYIAQSMFSRH